MKADDLKKAAESNNVENTSTQQLVDDFDNMLIPTAEGLIRLRELHLIDKQATSIHEKSPQDSLHSFRFSSSSSYNDTAATLRRQKSKGRVHSTLPGHYSTFGMAISSMDRIKTKTVDGPIKYASLTDRCRRKSLSTLSELPPSLVTVETKTNRTVSSPSTLTANTPGNGSRSSSTSTRNSSVNGNTVTLSTATTAIDEDDDDKEIQTDIEDSYVPHLHNRLKQQNQAILTTYDDWRIILTNSIAQDVLVSHLHPQLIEEQQMLLVGKSVLDLVEPSYQNRLRLMIIKRRNELREEALDNKNFQLLDNNGGMVLMCGNVIPIIKLDGTKSSASLWLKEKINEFGCSVYIWIFEEVYESTCSVHVNEEGIISEIGDTEASAAKGLFDYDKDELLGQPISLLIPSLEINSYWKSTVNNLRFFGSQTKKGAQFPIIVKLLDEKTTVQITSMPVIAGLMTIRQDGIIEGCNDIFVKYLFGFSQEELVSKKNISKLLPQFPSLLANLRQDDLLQPSLIINNIVCRKLLLNEDSSSMLKTIPTKGDYNSSSSSKRVLTHTPNNQPLPILVGIHRDGTAFEVQLQLKMVEEQGNTEYALWISFDREIAFKRYGHKHLISTKPQPQQNLTDSTEKEQLPTTKNVQATEKHQKSQFFPPASTTSTHDQKEETATATPPSITEISSSESVPSITAISEIHYSAQTKAVTIDDYIILDSLGQGAYGLVKLAIKRDDPSQTKVVIKYVIKSRILVDCWTRDRKLGTIPVEIHILHTLKKRPHNNLGDLIDYFEDSEYYYIVMSLHGEGMDLFDYIEINEHIPEQEIQRIFKQIVLGVCHLHDNKIVHRDIKDENVVLDQTNGGLRLIDFGSAAYLKPGREYETFVGTLDYAAPEILRGHTYSGKPQDVWALGILLFTLVYRENPFYDIDEIMGRELRVPFVLSEGSVDLISKMLERDVDKRIDIHQVRAHPWLTPLEA